MWGCKPQFHRQSGCETLLNVTTAFKSLRVIEEVDLSGLPLIEGDIKAFWAHLPPREPGNAGTCVA